MSLNNKYEYIAIDFETANSNLSSACAIGLVGARNGKVVYSDYYLINPNEIFTDYNIAIHHITPEMVKDAMTFPEVWEIIKDKLEGEIVFCHNAMFDIAVLKTCIEKYNLDYPHINIGCTLRVSRIAFKDILPNCKLNTISNYLMVEHNHHNASSDAMVCYYLLERVKRMYQAIDVIELFEMLNLGFGVLNDKIYKGCYSKLKEKKHTNDILKDEVFSFVGKPKYLTKTEVIKKIEDNSGLYSKEITKGITAIIIFPNAPKNKMAEFDRIKDKINIKVYNEEDFLNLLKGIKNG